MTDQPARGPAFWDDLYRSRGTVWSGAPNPHLVSEVADLPAGVALDLGSGEGADAIWLAENGWRVMAVDLSIVALERAAARAAERGDDIVARIDWIHADLTTWSPEPGSCDLVSAQFLHLPQPQRDDLLARLAAAVRPTGTLLVVGHHPADLTAGVPRPPAELLVAPEQLAASLDPDAWDVVVCAARERSATDPDGNPVTIHDSVLRARRR